MFNLSKNTNFPFKIAAINLVIVAIFGCILRLQLVYPIKGLVYPYLIHAHSHLAFLGWVFMALFVFLMKAYLPKESLVSGKFFYLFVVFQVANMGMLFTFPFTGYGLWSIVFSALHAFLSMCFATVFIRKAQISLSVKHLESFQFVKWGLLLMVLANLAPLALGPVKAMTGQSDWYYLLIYFYLHFQYNGWFTFAVIGLLLFLVEKAGVNSDNRLLRRFFMLSLVSVFPTYGLSALWLDPSFWIWLISGVSALVQFGGMFYFLLFVIQNKRKMENLLNIHEKVIVLLAVFAFMLKNCLQLGSAFPFAAEFAFANRSIVIGYLHLVLLGFVTLALWFIAFKFNLINSAKPLAKLASGLLVMGLFFNELFLILPAIVGAIPNLSQMLLVASLVMLLGCVLFYFSINHRHERDL
ncbi:hypothetical protein R9C00_17805 [Flammeovirgaceae bacterium SG7u.111]|nr:hypothetical protein [Flammeovirgaceae bacterium SG7u.132]WPO33559.1 hypothetical protein R9C00_17805 [Flammeovirgaceae bacterium SG7u.111]